MKKSNLFSHINPFAHFIKDQNTKTNDLQPQGIIKAPRLILHCDEFAVDANDADGIMSILSTLMQQDPTYTLFHIFPGEFDAAHPSMPKVTIDFHDGSQFETELNKLDNYRELEEQLNQTLMYKDQIVQIKIIPRSMAFKAFQARIYNFDPKIKSKIRITQIIQNRIKIHYSNKLYRWFINKLLENNYDITTINIAEYYLFLSPNIILNKSNFQLTNKDLINTKISDIKS